MNPVFNSENLKGPGHPESIVIFEQQGFFDDIPACYKSWQFKGISGESIVFLKKDLKDRKDTELIDKIKASQLVQTNSPITLSRNPPEYLFINFNFSE